MFPPEIIDESCRRIHHKRSTADNQCIRFAKRDENLRQRLIATKKEKEPVSAFCKICRELGYEIYEMELILAGEEFHAAMKRSTNGGGENSPMIAGEDDFYELFLAALKG